MEVLLRNPNGRIKMVALTSDVETMLSDAVDAHLNEGDNPFRATERALRLLTTEERAEISDQFINWLSRP